MQLLTEAEKLAIYDEFGECHKRRDFVELFGIVEKAVLAKLAEQQGSSKIYQCKLADESWIDQSQSSYEYNVKHGQATVRLVYTHPAPAQPVDEAAVQAVPEIINRTIHSRGSWQEIVRWMQAGRG